MQSCGRWPTLWQFEHLLWMPLQCFSRCCFILVIVSPQKKHWTFLCLPGCFLFCFAEYLPTRRMWSPANSAPLFCALSTCIPSLRRVLRSQDFSSASSRTVLLTVPMMTWSLIAVDSAVQSPLSQLNWQCLASVSTRLQKAVSV